MMNFERLKNELILDETTGFLYWKNSNQGRAAGERAGALCIDGYRHISFDNQVCQEHTIIWYIVYGVFEPNIDHKDRIRNNDAHEAYKVAQLKYFGEFAHVSY